VIQTFSFFERFGKIARALPLLLALSLPASAQFTLWPGSPVAAGAGPTSVAAGDFTGNGAQDLAIADYSTGKVTVLLANALGEFLPAPGSPFTAGTHPVSIAVFNYKGNASLAIANEGSNNMTILLGNGEGGFSNVTGIQLPAGSAPVSVVAGNFGGNPGLAIANFAANTVSLWVANASGVFTQAAGSPFPVGINPSSVAVGDFNGDGTPDFAVANKRDGTVSVFLSQATGGYAPPAGYSVLPQDTSAPSLAYPACVVTADFNADGILDLAVANEGTNNVTVLLGNGDGTFGPTFYTGPIPPISVGSSPFSMAVGYFNTDTYPDLAIANVGDNTITVLLGSATGSFTPASGSPFSVGIQPESVAVGYFNGNGWPGLAVANKGSNTVTLFTNTASGPVAVSAASLTPPVAPSSTISIIGSGLATAGTATNFPSTLGGSSVTITDYTGVQTILPLMSTSPTRITAFIPPTVNAGPNPSPVPVPPALLTVYSASGAQSSVVQLVPVAPGLYSASGNGKGVASAVFEGAQGQAPVYQCLPSTGSCVPVPIDLSAGGSLTLSATGIRNATGQVTVIFGAQKLTNPLVVVGPAGGALGDGGMDQVTVQIPANSQPSGLVQVSVQVSVATGVLTSNVVTIEVQ
jgi:hypothetical protein